MSELPGGIDSFLQSVGWSDADIDPLPGDASFRRYFRLSKDGGDTAMLMYAPPPHEDPVPFIRVAKWLGDHEQRAPRIYGEDAAKGWVLIEDFGHERMREWLDEHPDQEEQTYRCAVDALVQLHGKPPGPFEPYDMATYQRETSLLTEWYCPAMAIQPDEDTYTAAWEEVLTPLMQRQQPGVTVLRDYHAENIMLPDPQGGECGPQGLIDFQDALVGHPAYDLVSILQDARRDVPVALEAAMLEHYEREARPGDDFRADYARLGAQRNAKIVGIFVRLAKRDGKPHYLNLIPRVWGMLERDLAHPALAPVAAWFAANIPQSLRDARGGVVQ